MAIAIRPLEERDVAQSAEIERDAFPTLFPPTSFRRALKNGSSRYLVAWVGEAEAEGEPEWPDGRKPAEGGESQALVTKLLKRVGNMWVRRSAWEPGHQFLAGFVGISYLVDEAHIVSVGVRNGYRGRGIGELLLIAAIGQAMARGSSVVTLEVRVSNQVARNLYRKYGFGERGIRKGYYTDDREDAIIMTTDSIRDSDYWERFRLLVEAHHRRWGYVRPADF